MVAGYFRSNQLQTFPGLIFCTFVSQAVIGDNPVCHSP